MPRELFLLTPSHLPLPLIPHPEQTSPDESAGGSLESLRRQIEVLTASNEQLHAEVARYQNPVATRPARAAEDWRLLSQRLLAERDEEQKEISRELHDAIGQTMTGINVRLAVLRAETTAHAIEMHRKIAETERVVERSIEMMHHFASELHPAVLDDFGLEPALRGFVESLQMRSGVPVEITADPGIEALPVPVRTALYRIAREALETIARHAGASQVIVKIRRATSLVSMEIADEAVGFPLPFAATEEDEETRPELLAMKERAVMVGGTFQIKAPPGKGRALTVEIPLAESSGTAAAAAELNKTPFSAPSFT